jgi:hypothetical protein
MKLLHDEPDFADLLAVTGRNLGIDPSLVEKDYWIMHALWGLQQLGKTFELKGGTSLSKGFGLIHRFSEDIDIRIEPDKTLRVGHNHDKPQHAEGSPFRALSVLNATQHSMMKNSEAAAFVFSTKACTNFPRGSSKAFCSKRASTRSHPIVRVTSLRGLTTPRLRQD